MIYPIAMRPKSGAPLKRLQGPLSQKEIQDLESSDSEVIQGSVPQKKIMYGAGLWKVTQEVLSPAHYYAVFAEKPPADISMVSSRGLSSNVFILDLKPSEHGEWTEKYFHRSREVIHGRGQLPEAVVRPHETAPESSAAARPDDYPFQSSQETASLVLGSQADATSVRKLTSEELARVRAKIPQRVIEAVSEIGYRARRRKARDVELFELSNNQLVSCNTSFASLLIRDLNLAPLSPKVAVERVLVDLLEWCSSRKVSGNWGELIAQAGRVSLAVASRVDSRDASFF